ncbi:LacI family DNA-binding transcriptional regulator [Sinobaca sp. H24]|uniref:LacI family DNA-binding transcriptional regulator n=1 Tax=Sinobaca sp. H24 TaxID=2923376 RepID=UPI002079E177|nr:LacI family DNA-binding transcriptional regulator [Sinobaca sp. H24]
MGVTIKDVAEKAGVAPSTVSRVLSSHPSISDKTKAKVRRAMTEMGYVPNLHARRLAGRKTNTIGIVMPNDAGSSFENLFFPEILKAVSTYASKKGEGLYITTSQTEEEKLAEIKKNGGKPYGGWSYYFVFAKRRQAAQLSRKSEISLYSSWQSVSFPESIFCK